MSCVVLVGATLLAAVGWGIWRFTQKPSSAMDYQTAKVTRGDITQIVTSTGILNPVTNITVGQPAAGVGVFGRKMKDGIWRRSKVG